MIIFSSFMLPALHTTVASRELYVSTQTKLSQAFFLMIILFLTIKSSYK